MFNLKFIKRSSKHTPHSQKVGLNPHMESHGMYSVQWSYHFPMRIGLSIRSELTLTFPQDKVPGAARQSLAQSNLNLTRLSFADAASDVRSYSVEFYRDTFSLMDSLNQIKKTAAPSTIDRYSKWALLSFIQNVRPYWSGDFFARTGVFLKSDLKRNTKRIKDALRNLETEAHQDWTSYTKSKYKLLSTFRSVIRVARAGSIWQSLGKETSIRETFTEITDDPDFSNGKMLMRMRYLSEFSAMLLHKTLGELQNYLNNFKKSCYGSDTKQDQRITKEIIWLSRWTKICNELMNTCQLSSYTDVLLDPQSAAKYQERFSELKRVHYLPWDIDVTMRANEQRFNVLSTLVAAALSATVAFILTNFWLVTLIGKGQNPQIGTVAFVTFAFASVMIYVVRDGLNNWLKQNLIGVFRIRSGRWAGKCHLKYNNKIIEVANIERETWWEDDDDRNETTFHVWEEFVITHDTKLLDARIIKQSWRLPLDEILHSLDAASHILRIPTLDGIPQEVVVHKRNAFPYKLAVSVSDEKDGRQVIVDQVVVQGNVVTQGDRIEFID